MAKKSGKSAGRGKQGKSAPKAASRAAFPSVAARLPLSTPEKVRASTRKFVQGTLARGEAVPAGQSLPPGATHEIVGKDDEGTPILQRRRYSLVGSKPEATKKSSQPARKKK